MFSLFLSKCWAPCFTLRQSNTVSLEKGSILIALYTAFVHFFSLTYAIAILTDSVRTDVFYSPLFEFSKSTSRTLAIVLIVYSVLFIICCSLSLIHGIHSETRFFYLPWIWCTLMELLFMVSFGIFMVYRYWHYAWATFASLILWTYAAYHGYLFWAVVSLYNELKEKQEPTFIILYP